MEQVRVVNQLAISTGTVLVVTGEGEAIGARPYEPPPAKTLCPYCGGWTKDDARGNCAACGGPRDE